MRKSNTRIRRRSATVHEPGNPQKEGKDQKFFGAEGHEPFFQPAVVLQRAPEAKEEEKIKRAPEEKKEEKLARAPEEKKEEDKVHRAPEEKKEDDKVHRAPEEKKEEDKLQRAPEEKKEEDKLKRVPEEKKEEEKVRRAPEEKKEEEKIHKKGAAVGGVGEKTAKYVQNIGSRGQPMAEKDQAFYGERMGYNFSKVRIHTGRDAADSARDAGAKAYTYGDHVVFNEGRYDTDSDDGRTLIAHELTHVVQQGKAESGPHEFVHAIQQTPSPAQVTAMLQRAPADQPAQLAQSRRILQEAKRIAADLVEEVTGTVINNPLVGTKARVHRRHTQRILAELEAIANNHTLPDAERNAATSLHGQIEDLNNAARVAEIERDRAAGAPKTAERAAERAKAKFEPPATKPQGRQLPVKGGGSPTTKTEPTTKAPAGKTSPVVSPRKVAADLVRNDAQTRRMVQVTKGIRLFLGAWNAYNVLQDAAKAINMAAAVLAKGTPFDKQIQQARDIEATARDAEQYYGSLDFIKNRMPSKGDSEWDGWYDLSQLQLNYLLIESQLHEGLEAVQEVESNLKDQVRELRDEMAAKIAAAALIPVTEILWAEAMFFADAGGHMNASLLAAITHYSVAENSLKYWWRMTQAAAKALEVRLRELGVAGVFYDMSLSELKSADLDKFTFRR
jgi:hypothetical protein